MKQNTRTLNYLVVATMVGILGAGLSQAALVINVNDVGGQVVISATGSINIAAVAVAPTGTNANFSPYNNRNAFYAGDGSNVDYYKVGFANFTLGALSQVIPISSSGPIMVGVELDYLVVPAGYVSGSDLSGSTNTYSGSIASLGMTVGSQTRTFSNGSFSDSVTVNVGVVPEPGAWLMGMVGLGIFGLRRRRNF